MDAILPKIEVIAHQWFVFITASSIQLGLFLSFIFLVASIFKKQLARFLYLVWLVGLLKIFIPPAIKLPSFLSQSKFMLDNNIPILFIPEIQIGAANTTMLTYQGLLFLLWIVIIILLLLFWVSRVLLFQSRVARSCQEITDRIQLDRQPDHVKRVRFFTGPNIMIPFTRGLFAPRIYLPQSVLSWRQRELAALIFHELAHIQRKDLLVIGIQNVTQLLYFFHPLVWLANIQIARYREQACDDMAIQAMEGKSVEYGKLLLKFIDNVVSWKPMPSLASNFHQSEKFLMNRFHYILNRKESIMNRLNLFQKLVLVGLLIFGMVLSCQKQEQLSQPIQSLEQNGVVVKKAQNLEAPLLKSPSVDSAAFFVAYDEPPKPVGGFEAIQENLVYPELARRAGIEGQVTIYAQIGVNGEVIDTRILKSLGENNGCDEAAVAAVKAVKWQPAKQRGMPVPVWISIPVNFKIQGDRVNQKRSAVPSNQADKIEKITTAPLTYTPASLPADEAATFFVPYDKPPEPIGGFEAIQRHLIYPELAQKAGIEGQVTVYARIDENGDVIDTKLLVPLGESGCNEAAVAAIKSVKWKPARQNDKPVSVWISVPIRFRLN